MFFGALLLSITLHEFAHALMGYKLGDDTAHLSGRLTLNPLAHVDLFTTILLPLILFISGLPVFGAAKPVPFNPRKVRGGEMGAALVAAAGPLTNLLLVGIAGVGLQLGNVTNEYVQFFFGIFIFINAGFFVFNMIPFPPLDGSRILYAFSPDSLRRYMNIIEGYGLFAIGIFIFFVLPIFSPAMISAINFVIRNLAPTIL